MVQAMPGSEFIRYFRASKMLAADGQMRAIEASSFHAFKESHREAVMRELKSLSKRWLFEPLKDFKEIAANFAKRLQDGR